MQSSSKINFTWRGKMIGGHMQRDTTKYPKHGTSPKTSKTEAYCWSKDNFNCACAYGTKNLGCG